MPFTEISSQNFTIEPIRIEYINPDTHKLTTLTEGLCDIKAVELSRVDNYFDIFFTKHQDDDPDDINYFFKLYNESPSSNWFSFEDKLRLVGLDNGSYILQIIGKTNEGLQSENTIEILLEVPPPYWRTWRFFLLIGLVIVGIISLWRVYEYKVFKVQKDKDLEISNLEARAYRAQMNPHFIFNALNGMQAAMLLHGEEEFNKYISSFSKLIRDTIEMSSQDKLSLSDELQYIQNYIALQALRLEKPIHLTFHIDDKIIPEQVFLPCMMLQPIVENAIVHGLIPKEGENKIDIHFYHQIYFLKCRVIDNGIGRVEAKKQSEGYETTHKSFATKIMKERIDIFNHYNKRELSFSIKDLYDEDGKANGTAVNLMVPLEFKSRIK